MLLLENQSGDVIGGGVGGQPANKGRANEGPRSAKVGINRVGEVPRRGRRDAPAEGPLSLSATPPRHRAASENGRCDLPQRRLIQNEAPIELLVDEVHSGPAVPHVGRNHRFVNGGAVHPLPAKRGQEGGVHVDHATCEGADKGGGNEAEVSGEDDDVDGGDGGGTVSFDQEGSHGVPISGGGHDKARRGGRARLGRGEANDGDTKGARVVGSAARGYVGDNDGDASFDAAFAAGGVEGPEV